MSPTQLILVGGFLGAGKTTLLSQASKLLAQRGKKVGLIANDQAANLVDSSLLRLTGSAVEEVAGGCFCCKFTDLMEVAERLIETDAPDVIIGEPVGSCTDLSATVLQPLKQMYANKYRLSPFSVLLDVRGLRLSLERAGKDRFSDNVLYIYHKQIEEADVLVLNKADLVSTTETEELKVMLTQEFPQTPIFTISALNNLGIAEWLDYVMADHPTGHAIAEVDYDRYAEGEAALGWMNATVRLSGEARPDWKKIVVDLMEAMRNEFKSSQAEIAHLKLFLQAGNFTVAANLTNNSEDVYLWATGEASPKDTTTEMFVNARVHVDPQTLCKVLERCLPQIQPAGIDAQITSLESFSPSRPQPVHRFTSPVGNHPTN